MSINRRGFLGALAAPFVAKLLPKKVVRPDIGVSIRFMRHYDSRNSLWVNRVDVMYGLPSTPVGEAIHLPTPPRYSERARS